MTKKIDENKTPELDLVNKVDPDTELNVDTAETEILERSLESIVTPGQLVLKRFLRNKLAIIGLLVLLVMFIFSFIGPFFAKYGEYEVSYKVEPIEKIYVVTGDNHLVRVRMGDGLFDWDLHIDKPIIGLPQVSLTDGNLYLPVEGGVYIYNTEDLSDPELVGFEEGVIEDVVADQEIYQPPVTKKEGFSWRQDDDGSLYEIKERKKKKPKERRLGGEDVMEPGQWYVNSQANVIAMTTEGKLIEFRTGQRSQGWFVDLPTYGYQGPFQTVHSMAATKRIDTTVKPNSKHWLGTDQLGFDVFTRLMYGGRISLMVGFCVVFLQIILGTIMGGISGYYGKWVDGVIMRLVDIFFCIPSMPLIMMINTSLTKTKIISSENSIYVLMLILGILGWAGVARFVRGQILSLREQEYMIAAEATGLKVRHRIFRHLIPNVLPLLIVMATLGIGGTILFESALSFLGFGLQFPYASWGNMVNPVTDPIVMKQFLHIWVPPGLCILLTVMAFNFVGDGLRDALDPKMKR